jgi:hypothetical protein
MREVADEYDFIGDVGRTWSVGATSVEWIAATFDRRWADAIAETAYISNNGYAQTILEKNENPNPDWQFDPFRYGAWNTVHASEMGRLEHVWKHEYESGAGNNSPRFITDRAVALGREYDFDRYLLHYMCPHQPLQANAIAEDREMTDYEMNPFSYLRETGDRETVYQAYLDELRFVLDDVEILLKNIDGEDVIITADHGEAFGEYGSYRHPTGSVNPYVRYVPWVTTTACDEGTYEPECEPVLAKSNSSIEETLKHLGYNA